MVRITDPERSRAFYEALGMEFRRDMDIVRGGEKEATNYFFGYAGQEEELELTFNHDGSTYELGTGYGHIAIGVDDLDGTLARLAEQGIEPERAPYRCARAGRGSASSATRMVTGGPLTHFLWLDHAPFGVGQDRPMISTL
jgi:lactoylglutathione lyase